MQDVCVSCSVPSDSLRPKGLWPTRLLRPRKCPGENTRGAAVPSSRGSSLAQDGTQAHRTGGAAVPSSRGSALAQDGTQAHRTGGRLWTEPPEELTTKGRIIYMKKSSAATKENRETQHHRSLLLLPGGSPGVDSLSFTFILLSKGIENFIKVFCLSRPCDIAKQNVIGSNVSTIKSTRKHMRTFILKT